MEKIKDFVFGKPLDPKEEVRKWKRVLAQNIREVDKNIRHIDLDVKKNLAEIKRLLRKKDMTNAKTMARQVVTTKKMMKRFFASKSLMSQMGRELDHSLSMMRVHGALQKSVNIMSYLNRLVKIPEMAAVMKALSMEMDKLGLIDDMMDEALGAGSDEEEVEEATEEEISRILDDITIHELNQLPSVKRVPQGSVKVAGNQVAARPVASGAAEADGDL